MKMYRKNIKERKIYKNNTESEDELEPIQQQRQQEKKKMCSETQETIPKGEWAYIKDEKEEVTNTILHENIHKIIMPITKKTI